MKNTIITVLFLFLFLMVFPSCTQQKPGGKGAIWKGMIETIDGATVVKNPLEPMYGEEAFVLEEELTVGEAEGKEEYMFQSLRALAVNGDGDIFALDYKAQHVKVFDRYGSYLRTIGRPGQGPGELFLPQSLVHTGFDELIIGNISSIVYFSPQGEHLKSIPLSRARILSIDIDSTGNILGYSIEREEMVYALKKYDQQLNELLTFGSSPLPTDEFNRTGKWNAFFTLLRWDIINGNQVVTGYPEEGYVIKILDASGKLIRRIEKEYIPVEITQKDYEEAIADHPPELRKDYYAPKHFPPFRTVRADDEGRVWVTTSERTPDKEGRIWDVFDSEGKYILKLALKASPRVIQNNRMYTIEEDENGFHCIKRYRISWRIGE